MFTSFLFAFQWIAVYNYFVTFRAILNRCEERLLDTHRITQNFNSNKGPDQQLKPGTTLVDRYMIQEVIGVGGMGSVYRARDLHFPNVVKLVAVKEMINQVRDPLVRQTIMQTFEREANILVTLNHPSIPRIFDYFIFEERAYLVIEYINGKDLDVILSDSEQFISEDTVIQWGIELCDVLQFLHNHKPEPIIFRDMKPSNVMVNQNNHIVLVDFGIAKMFKQGLKGTMIGTEGYSPPEQYRGDASPVADIYALGATLHHLLTRKDPRLETPFTFIERGIRKTNPAVSLELETVINTALQYNPEDRYQNAEAMKEALLLVARKTGALGRMSVQTAQINTQAGGIKPLWIFKAEDEIRGSPAVDGGVVYFGSYDNNLYALGATNGEFVWKYPTDGGIVGKPAIASGNVFVGSEDGRLHAVSQKYGKVNWTYGADGPIRSSPKVAEGHVFFGCDDNFLHAVNLFTTRRAWRVDAADAVRSSPFIANDQVYFGSEGGELFCVDFRGEVKWRFRAKRAITSSPIVAQGSVFFSSIDSQIYAVDAKSGWVLWRYRMGKGSISSPCKIDNFVIVGSADGAIYCVDSASAREIWRFQAEHQVSGSPVIYNDAVYCGTAGGMIYCLEYRTGRLRWKFTTGGSITGTPVVYNDVLYIGSADHILYALMV
jgi:outer membrane protein assembly factor BamB/tRNA A-37 threonylcarbamoyl transferase component Bud32